MRSFVFSVAMKRLRPVPLTTVGISIMATLDSPPVAKKRKRSQKYGKEWKNTYKANGTVCHWNGGLADVKRCGLGENHKRSESLQRNQKALIPYSQDISPEHEKLGKLTSRLHTCLQLRLSRLGVHVI